MKKEQALVKAEESITSKELQEVGITSQITQGDIIDIIAEESMATVRAKIEEFNNEIRTIAAKADKLVLDRRRKFAEIVGVDPEMIDMTWTNARYYGTFRFELLTLQEFNTRSTEEYRLMEHGKRMSELPDLRGKTDKKVVKVTFTTNDEGPESDEIEYKSEGFSISKTIKTHIKYTTDINVKVSEVVRFIEQTYDVYKRAHEYFKTLTGDKDALSPTRLAKQAKIKLNKRILQSQAPEIRSKLAELFNVKL